MNAILERPQIETKMRQKLILVLRTLNFRLPALLPFLPVMAAIAERKKVISIGHFLPCFRLQSMQSFLFLRINQKQLYELNALKIKIGLRQMS